MVLVESFSGIRGIYGSELTEVITEKYAQAYMNLLNKKYPDKTSFKIVIGRDSRKSSEELLKIFINNINCEIINIGLMPTPVIENAVRVFNAHGGIIITASHNEPNFNGFKFLDKDGAILRPKDIDFVINQVKLIKDIPQANRNAKITNKEKEALEKYENLLEDILKINKINSGVKIVVDPNGGSGIVLKKIFDKFNINAHYINMNIGEFKRLIEPKEESLKYLEKYIKEQNADFAVGFDCDADRVEILLNNGELVSGNHILALIAEEIFSEDNNSNTKKSIVVNDATSYIIKEITEKYNSEFKEVEVGEINVVDEMLVLNSPIGGEGSNGGVIIPPSRCRDGILTVLLLLKIISKRKKSLKELIDELPKYYYIKEKINLKEDFVKLKDKVRQYYLNKNFQILETGDETGGLKAIKNNSWVWFRQSKTEDKILRIIADSKNENTAKELLIEAKILLIKQEQLQDIK